MSCLSLSLSGLGFYIYIALVPNKLKMVRGLCVSWSWTTTLLLLLIVIRENKIMIRNAHNSLNLNGITVGIGVNCFLTEGLQKKEDQI